MKWIFKFKKRQPFDHIIPLGVNCEIAFALQGLFGGLDSTLFTWAFVEDPFILSRYMHNPEMLFAGGLTLTPSKMFRCNETRFVFHSKLLKEHHVLDAAGELSPDRLTEAKKEVCSRVTHLSNKFWRHIRSEDRNLFVIKLFSKDEYQSRIGNLLAELTESLDQKCANKNFALMCVLEEHFAPSLVREISDDRLVIKRIHQFAHYAATNQYDKKAWEKIYKDICIK
jgi:hypothetical protein